MQRHPKETLIFENISMSKIYEQTIQKLFNSKDTKVKQQHLTSSTFNQLWKVFTRWTECQLEINRSVNLGRFGIAYYKIASDEKVDRTIQISFVVSFLMCYNLQQSNDNIQDFGCPVVKINYQWIAKSVNIDKSEIIVMLTSLFDEIQDLLVLKKNQEIDLELFGIITTDLKGTLTMKPIKKKSQVKQLNLGRLFDNQSFQQVKNLVNQAIIIPAPTSQSMNAQYNQNQLYMSQVSRNSSALQSPQALDVDTSVFLHSQHTQPFYIGGPPNELNSKIRTLPISFRSNQSADSKDPQKQQNKLKFVNQFRKIEPLQPRSISPTRRVMNPEFTKIPPELMSRGQDPLTREHTFSLHASNGKDLFKSVFVSSQMNQDYNRLPPVCDLFSRTLASPLNSVASTIYGNIGSNYSMNVKRLQMDPISMQLVFLKEGHLQKEKNKRFRMPVNGRIGNQRPPHIASIQEELIFAMHGMKAKELQQRVLEKAKQYQKYVHYVTQGINNDQIAEVKTIWIHNVIQQIKQETYFSLDKEFIKVQIDVMLQEVVDLYYFYIKSSILDYVLLDQGEQQRLGLRQMQLAPQWGQRVVYYREVTKKQKLKLKQNRLYLQQTLLCYQQSTIQMMKVWISLIHVKPLIQIEEVRIIPISVKQFCQIQMNMIESARNALNNQWIRQVALIYQSYLAQMTQALGQLGDFPERFYRNHAALMNILLREYITNNVSLYRSYMNRWRSDYFQQLITVKVLEYVSHTEAHFDFEDTAHNMRDQFMKVIEEILITSQKLLRPESISLEPQYLQQLYFNETVFSEIFSDTNNLIEINIERAIQVLPVFQKYAYLFKQMDNVVMKITGKTAQQIQDQPTLLLENFITLYQQKSLIFTNQTLMSRGDLKKEIDKFKLIWQAIIIDVPNEIKTNMFVVCGTSAKRRMLMVCDTIIDMYVQATYEYIKVKSQTLYTEASRILDQISIQVEETSKLIELETIIDMVIKLDYFRLLKDFKELVKWILFMYDYQVRISYEDLRQFNNTSIIIQSMLEKGNQEFQRIKSQREHFENILIKKKNDLIQGIKQFQLLIDGLKDFTSVFMSREANEYIDKLNDQKYEVQNEVKLVNDEEDLLGIDLSSYPVLDQQKEVLKTYEDLWRLVRKYQQNMDFWKRDSCLFKLDPQAMDQETENMLQMAQHLYPIFLKAEEERRMTKKSSFEPLTVVSDLLANILDFKRHIPLIHCLCSQGIKERHWEKISRLFGFPISSDIQIQMKRLIELEMIVHIQDLQEITKYAALAYQFEITLQLKIDQWKDIRVEIIDFGLVTGIHQEKIFNLEKLSDKLSIIDDDLIAIEGMSSNPYAATFAKKIQNQIGWLNFTKELIPNLIENQKLFLHGAALFFQTDAARQIPEGFMRWKEILKNWRYVVDIGLKYPRINDFTMRTDILPMMQANIKSFEFLYKGLSYYLDTKRIKFPRFYSLSESQLITLLSNYQNQVCVLPYLNQFFQGVDNIILENKLVSGFQAGAEQLIFQSQIYIHNFTGNPEGLISQLEEAMYETIRSGVQKQHIDYQSPAQNYLVSKQQVLQLCLLNHDLWYTIQTELAIKSASISQFIKKIQVISSDISQAMRQTKRSFTYKELHNLSSILINECAWRDVVQNLELLGVQQLDDFHWQYQIKTHVCQDQVQISIGGATMNYGYEYVKITNLVVATSLTMRIFSNVAMAQKGCLVVRDIPGRSSSFKDLSRRCGRQYSNLISVDPQEPWDQVFARVAKGVATNGLWLCNDNNLDLDQIYKLAQFAQKIHQVLQEDFDTVNLFGHDLQVRRGFKVCLVVSYKQLNELPDHIKINFRKLAILVPPLQEIIQIQLFSLGFIEFKNLAAKMVFLFDQICSIQPEKTPLFLMKQTFQQILQFKAQYHQKDTDFTEFESLSEIGQELVVLKDTLFQVILDNYKEESQEIILKSIDNVLSNTTIQEQFKAQKNNIWEFKELKI